MCAASWTSKRIRKAWQRAYLRSIPYQLEVNQNTTKCSLVQDKQSIGIRYQMHHLLKTRDYKVAEINSMLLVIIIQICLVILATEYALFWTSLIYETY